MDFMYEFSTALICILFDTVDPLSIYYQEVFCLIFNIYIQFISFPSSRAEDTIPIYLYLRLIHRPTGSLHSNMECPFPGPWLGPRHPQLTSIHTQISWTDIVTDQTSLTDVCLWPNISNRRWTQVNSLFLSQQLPFRWCGQSQVMWAPTKYLQQSSGLPRSPSSYNHLTCQMLMLLPTSPDIRCGPTNFPQQPLRLPGIFSTNTRTFKPGSVTPPKMSERLSPGGPLTRSLDTLSICITKRLFLVFLVLWLAHPF